MVEDPPTRRTVQEAGSTAQQPSFAAVFDTYVGFVGRTLRHLGVDEHDLEDLTQEVFLAVHHGLPEFEGRAALRTWIYRIAWNTAANYRRREANRSRRFTELEGDIEAAATQERSLTRQRSRERLSALLEQLDDGQRSVFVLYEIEQLPMREVADIVGCPVQTGYSRLKAARARLLDAARRAGWKDASDV